MSNCVMADKTFECGVELDAMMFPGVREASDVDGTSITKEQNGAMVLRVGCTTWREFRNFLWTHVQPFVDVPNVRIPLVLRDESDGFEAAFKATAKLLPPGTQMREAEMTKEQVKERWQMIL